MRIDDAAREFGWSAVDFIELDAEGEAHTSSRPHASCWILDCVNALRSC